MLVSDNEGPEITQLKHFHCYAETRLYRIFSSTDFFLFFLIRCHNSACTKHYCFILFPYAGFKLVIIYHSSHNEKKGDIYIYIYNIVYLIEMFWCFIQDFNLSVI